MCRHYDISVTTGSPSFEPLNGVTNGNFIAGSGLGILTVASFDFLDQINGSWATTDCQGGYADWRGLRHTYHLTAGNLAHRRED
jgi:hypothetical protein